MGDKVKSVVRIAGNEYTLSADTSEEYIHKVAIYVDRKMMQIQKLRPEFSTAMIAVLAAVNIADELFEARGERDALITADSGQPASAGGDFTQISLLNNITHIKDAKKG